MQKLLNWRKTSKLKGDLDLRDFFDAYDRHNPYHLAAVSELYAKIKNTAPEVLTKEQDWYRNWTWGGKRNLQDGSRLNNGRTTRTT